MPRKRTYRPKGSRPKLGKPKTRQRLTSQWRKKGKRK